MWLRIVGELRVVMAPKHRGRSSDIEVPIQEPILSRGQSNMEDVIRAQILDRKDRDGNLLWK